MKQYMMEQNKSFLVTSNAMSDAVIVSPNIEMVGPRQGKAESSPVSVAHKLDSPNEAPQPPLTPSRGFNSETREARCEQDMMELDHDVVSGGQELNHVVVVGEDGGAEVTLEFSSFGERPYRNVAALLDTDMTPSPRKTRARSLDTVRLTPMDGAPPQQRRSEPVQIQESPANATSPMGPSFCCGRSCWHDSDTTLGGTNQENLEETICGLLGSTASAANLDDCCFEGWQAFSYFLLGPDQREWTSPHLKQDIRQALRNRAFNMNARSKRMQELRKNLRPFEDQEIVPLAKETVPITKTSSFCVSDQPTRSKTVESSSVVSMGSAVWSVVDCSSGFPTESSPAVARFKSRHEDDDLCYDSDPEEITHRRDESSKKACTFLQRGAWEDDSLYDEPTAQDFEALAPKRLNFDAHDEVSVKEMVRDFMNERMTLIWHRGGHTTDEQNGPPLAVKAWIEHGHRLRSTLIQPKLMWKPANEVNEQTSLGISSKNLRSIDLLDILRILEADRIDHRRFALAKRTNCFIVESLDDLVMFEARSEEERDRIVHYLKLVVARLGSKVVVGDANIFDEFFGFVPVGSLEDTSAW